MKDLLKFYMDEQVRRRICEYCGAQTFNTDSFTAKYLVGYGGALESETGKTDGYMSLPTKGFDTILNKGLDIFRSTWDSDSTLGILDMEYFDLDFPGEIYLKQEQTFIKIEPLQEIVLKNFFKFNIHPLVIMTGRGYHFATKVSSKSKANQELVNIGKIDSSLQMGCIRNSLFRGISLSQMKSYDGMGRLLEYFVHLILRETQKYMELQVVPTDVAVVYRQERREAVSLDLSMYGDPLYTRAVRCPFSTYQKHKIQKYKVGEIVATQTPIQVTLPRKETITLKELFSIRRNFSESARYARDIRTEVPDASLAFENLILSYKRSRLFQFHKYFDSVEHVPEEQWPDTYDRFDINLLPSCIAHALREPNDHLLKPTNIQMITRVLTKMKWHPKHIAGLIRSKYERSDNWGDTWEEYNPPTRANFYVRLFAGMIYDGTDKMEDLDCIAHQQKGYCWVPWCGFDLKKYRTG